MSLIMKLQQLQGGDLEKLQSLYQNLEFPMEIRYYCAHWIEAQNWSSIDIDNPVFEPDAIDLLHGMIKQVQAKIEELSDDEMFPIKLKLNNFTQELNKRFSNQPFAFVRLINHCLESEERLVQNSMQNRTVESPQAPPCNKDITENITNIRMMTQKTEEDLSNLQQKQEMFVFQYQENLRFQGRLNQLANSPLAESDPNRRAEEISLRKKKAEVEQQLQTEAQELLRMRMDLAEKHRKTLYSLKILQSRVLEDELIRWKRQQQLAGIGGPPEGTLDQQQCWCEALAELIWHNRQQVKKVELLRQQLPIPVPHGQDLLPELNRCFMAQLSTLVTSTFIIEKQPPQVLKKETRFSASVRLLVGGKLNVHMNPPQVKATIISESQAKAVLASETSSWNETSGDILNNCGVMEYHRETGVLNVTFRNMSLKRIRRADRRGSEFVTEEKFTILFQSQFSVASGELVFQVRTMSLPVVVIVHGNQESNALATVLWDNAFASSGRVPFVVPDGVPFADMGRALNSKFMLANGRSLSDANLLYLAQKAFSHHNVGQTEDFSNVYITWSIFNRDPLPNRTFTFWRWFHGVLELTRKHLRGPWNDGSIMGFVSRSMAHDLLLSQQVGCFLLRFSDSEIGGITIAWLAEDANTGERQVYNLQPFTADDFNIRSLADRIHDLSHLTHLYPDKPKDTAFGQYYTTDPEVPPQGDGGYVPTSLVSHIPHMPGGPPQHHSQEMGNREPMSPPSQQLMTSSSLRVSSSDGMVGTTSMDQNLDPLEELPILEDYDDPQAGIMEDLLRWSASTS